MIPCAAATCCPTCQSKCFLREVSHVRWARSQMRLADSVMAGKSSEGSIKWQLCYDISARTWWMVSWHELLSSFFSFSFPPAKHPRSPLLLSLLPSAPLCSSRGVGASLHSEAQTCQSADKVAPRPCPRAPAGTYGADTPASPLPHRDVPGRAGLRPRSAAPWWRVRFGGPAVVPRSFLKLRGGGTCSSRSPSLSAETQRRLNAAEQLRELCIPPVTLFRPLPPPVPGPRREILGEEFPLK